MSHSNEGTTGGRLQEFISEIQNNLDNEPSTSEESMSDIDLISDLDPYDSESTKQKKTDCSFKYVYNEYLKYDRNKLSKFYVLLVNLLMPMISICIVSILSYIFDEPFIFPSLGPTAFLHFALPDHPPSSPHNTIFGHLIAIIMGYIGLIISGLQNNESVFIEGITFERIGCASFCIGTTCFCMILLLLNHPPSGATTLVIALGLLTKLKQFGLMMISILIMTITSFILNRIIRKDAIYPLWTNNKDKIIEHIKQLLRCRYLSEFTSYDRSNVHFIHLLFINLLCTAIALFIVGLIGYYSNLPFLFPSLGPTIFIQFAIFAQAPASPRNTLLGHGIGIIFGYVGLLLFGLSDNASVAIEGVTINRIQCITLSLGITCALMVLFKCQHPPAAATTLIVAMGILKSYIELVVLVASIVILTIFAFIMNRILRNDDIYPIWAKHTKDEAQEPKLTYRRSDCYRGKVLEEFLGYHRFPFLEYQTYHRHTVVPNASDSQLDNT